MERSENRQYEKMLHAAKQKLLGRTGKDLAEQGNLVFLEETQEFVVTVFGQELRIHYPDFTVMPKPDMWLELSVLQYMDEADGTELTGNYMALSEFEQGGLIRGSSFDRENEKIVQQGIGKMSVEEATSAIDSMGGILVQGKGDLSAAFSFMPNFPLLLNLWFEDEEFPASCKVLFDRSAEHYLKVEAAGTVAGILLQSLSSK